MRMVLQQRWRPEDVARRDAEYVRLLATADAATRRMALRLEAARSAGRHKHTRQPVDAAAGPQTVQPDGGTGAKPRRRRRKSEAKRQKDAEKLEGKWQQRRAASPLPVQQNREQDGGGRQSAAPPALSAGADAASEPEAAGGGHSEGLRPPPAVELPASAPTASQEQVRELTAVNEQLLRRVAELECALAQLRQQPLPAAVRQPFLGAKIKSYAEILADKKAAKRPVEPGQGVPDVERAKRCASCSCACACAACDASCSASAPGM